MDSPVGYIPLWVDLLAVTIGGVVGALAAARARFDINGALILAILTGLGGGIVRDLIIQETPPTAFASPWLLPASALAGLLTFVFSRQASFVSGRFSNLMLVLDAVLLALYTVVGTAKAIDVGLPAVSAVMLGIVTGVGGGMLRDILLNIQPSVLKPGTFEALAALIGAAVQVLLALLIPDWIAAIIAFVVVVAVRLLSALLRWRTRVARIAPPTGSVPTSPDPGRSPDVSGGA